MNRTYKYENSLKYPLINYKYFERIFKEYNLLNKILDSCISTIDILMFDIPIGLATRLILTDDDSVQLIIDQFNNSNEVIISFSILN